MLGVADQYHTVDDVAEVNGFIAPILQGSFLYKSLGTRLLPHSPHIYDSIITSTLDRASICLL